MTRGDHRGEITGGNLPEGDYWGNYQEEITGGIHGGGNHLLQFSVPLSQINEPFSESNDTTCIAFNTD